MKARIAFDTLAYANKLKTAGMAPNLAEAQAEASADMVAVLIDSTLATKEDIASLSSATKQDLLQLRKEVAQVTTELRQEMTQLSTELRQEMTQLSTELRQEMTQLSIELRRETAELAAETRLGFASIRAEMLALEMRLLTKLGALTVASITIGIGVVSAFHLVH